MTLAQMSQVTSVSHKANPNRSTSTPVADPESVVTLTARSLESGRTQQPTEEQEGRELRKTSQEVKTVAASHRHHSFIDSDNFIINVGQVTWWVWLVWLWVCTLVCDRRATCGSGPETWWWNHVRRWRWHDWPKDRDLYKKQCDDRNGPSPRTAGNRYLISHFYTYDSSPEHRLYALTWFVKEINDHTFPNRLKQIE